MVRKTHTPPAPTPTADILNQLTQAKAMAQAEFAHANLVP